MVLDAIHAYLRMAQLQLHALVEFYEHTRASFDCRLNAFERKAEGKPESYWNESVGSGLTRSDIASEEHGKLEELAALNGYFGVLSAYATLDSFLYQTFEYAKMHKMPVPTAFQNKRSLDLVGYKDVLKACGVDISKPTKYEELIKLRDIRNTIAHYGGWVEPEMENSLRKYKFKVGSKIKISDGYFRSSVGLVKTTCQQITKLFVEQLELLECERKKRPTRKSK